MNKINRYLSIMLLVFANIKLANCANLHSNGESHQNYQYIHNYHEMIVPSYLLDDIITMLEFKLSRNIQGVILSNKLEKTNQYMFNDPMFIVNFYFNTNSDNIDFNAHMGWGLTGISNYSQNANIVMPLSDISKIYPDKPNLVNFITSDLSGTLKDSKKKLYSLDKSKLDITFEYIPTSYHWTYQAGFNINFYDLENQFFMQYITNNYNAQYEDVTLKFMCLYSSSFSSMISSLCSNSRNITLPNMQSSSAIYYQDYPVIENNMINLQLSTVYNLQLLSLKSGNIYLYFGGKIGSLILTQNPINNSHILFTFMPNIGFKYVNEFITFKFGLDLIEISIHTNV